MSHADLPQPPVAPQRPSTRTYHGHTVEDPYAWMADREDPELIAYLTAENAYADARTAHLDPLRESIFREIKSRVQESDLSVPVGDGNWWYYTRTIEGEQYAVHARCPRPTPDAPRPELAAGGIPEGEQVLLDGNAAARGHDFFAVGALAVSHDERLVVAGIDLEGDERFALTVRDIATGEVIDDAIAEVGYGAEFDRSGHYLFYVVVDEAWRPFQVWRHEIGTPRAQDVLIRQEDDERFWMGLGSSREDRFLMIGLGTKTTSETWLLPADDPQYDAGKGQRFAPIAHVSPVLDGETIRLGEVTVTELDCALTPAAFCARSRSVSVRSPMPWNANDSESGSGIVVVTPPVTSSSRLVGSPPV